MASVLVLLALPVPASAVVITPNTTEDQFNTDPAHCSLREAVESSESGNGLAPGCPAGAIAGPDTIQLPSGTYELDLPAEDPNVNSFDRSTGDLDIGGTLVVEAAPGASVTIDANGNDRIFSTAGSSPLTIDGVTLTGAYVDTPGAGTGTNGGAIATCCSAPLTIIEATLTGNSADGSGGAVLASGPTTITNSTISGNESREFGGGGISTSGPTLTIESSTISANVGRSGGGLSGGSSATGGVANPFGSTVSVHNSIIAGNTENATDTNQPDCQGSLTSTGGNVIGSNAGCTFSAQASDSVNAAGGPGLTPLAMRGGPTATHGLLATSPAIDRGVPTCATTDQRGVSRSGLGSTCDSGAFELGPNHTLTVNPPTNGSVTAAGISCPGDCTESYADGSNVPLTPVPDSGFSFAGWTGDCSGTGSCSAVMDADRTIGANFAASRTLTVTVTGPGSVTGPQIACPGDCSGIYAHGTLVTLSQTPGTNAVFAGWSGGCTGVGTCDLTMDADKAVTANFLPPRTLSVTVTGSGTVTGAGIACPGDCTEDYPDGTVVPLTQTAGAGALFSSWAGDCTGAAACSPTMSSNRAVTATFTAIPLAPPAVTPAKKKCKKGRKLKRGKCVKKKRKKKL